jgi:IS4 transposase
VFLTNNFDIPAKTVADVYKQRWQVELFFKWIKQHLRFKKFYGTSENAVKSQIWVGLSMYLLVAIAKKDSAFSARCTLFYRFLRSTYSRESPFHHWLQRLSNKKRIHSKITS